MVEEVKKQESQSCEEGVDLVDYGVAGDDDDTFGVAVGVAYQASF